MTQSNNRHSYTYKFTQRDLNADNLLLVKHCLGVRPTEIAVWNEAGERVAFDAVKRNDKTISVFEFSSIQPIVGFYSIMLAW